MPDGDVWTLQMIVLMSVKAICHWNCNNPTFRSKVMMILGMGKYCNTNKCIFSIYHIRIFECVVASLQNCIQLYDGVAFDFCRACLCWTDTAKVVNNIFWEDSGTQNSKH
jgi:hypothetical protein